MSLMASFYLSEIYQYGRTHTEPRKPIHYSIINKITPNNDNLHLIIFDLDHTLFYETIFPQVEEILNYVRNNNIYMSMASHNNFALSYCKRYGMDKYFDVICGYSGLDKIEHINIILKYYEKNDVIIPQDKILFIDDQNHILENIKEEFGIKILKVEQYVGVQKKDVEKILNSSP